MHMTVCDPSGIYPSTRDYAHAMLVHHPERLLFVSGTMGLDANGVAGDDLDQQLVMIWANIQAILAEAGMTAANIVRVTSYLTDRAYAEANQKARIAALDGRAVPTIALVVQTLRDEWLVEIEVIAAS